jgi:hypothetical protein
MPPSIYPTGTTIYYPEKCWNGYTLFPAELHRNNGYGAVLIDMNGNIVNRWQGLDGFPNKMLPNGNIMGSTGVRNMKYGFQDMLDLVEVDWDGKIVWKFNRFERVKDPRQKARWMARQHHDYQREGNPVGYYVPRMKAKADGKTLLICHKNLTNKKISDKSLVDDVIIEVDGRGKITWEWVCSEHFEEMGFDEEAKEAIRRNPGISPMTCGKGDWMHMNSISTLGPNRLYDKGDKRFYPDNIIISGRQTNIVAIIDRKTGKIVWKLGPYFTANEKLKKIGQIIGQHHTHLIPRGLKGEGNLLLFDNGGAAGYGAPNPTSLDGINNAKRNKVAVSGANDDVGRGEALQLLHQFGTATTQRQHDDNGGQHREDYRGDTGAGNSLGIHQPLPAPNDEDQYDLPRLPRALQLGDASGKGGGNRDT